MRDPEMPVLPPNAEGPLTIKTSYERVCEGAQDPWQLIETAPKDTFKVCGPTLILGHNTKKWIRFGKWYVQERRWYYSGTSERSQWAQVRGDEPTHWMPTPAYPK